MCGMELHAIAKDSQTIIAKLNHGIKAAEDMQNPSGQISSVYMWSLPNHVFVVYIRSVHPSIII